MFPGAGAWASGVFGLSIKLAFFAFAGNKGTAYERHEIHLHFDLVDGVAIRGRILLNPERRPDQSPRRPCGKETPTQLVDVSKAEKLVAEKKVVVLDVRTPAEFAKGHIAGATNLDFRDAEFKAKVAKLDKNQPYLVNCAAGGRSAKACEAMGQLDFKVLDHLQGGMTAWEKAGKPVQRTGRKPGTPWLCRFRAVYCPPPSWVDLSCMPRLG